ncbi:MAG: HD domain-containing protein [Gammaproteobacteria bacterium]|nr:HD domain-containing protein [Gammaproteobacteria bacterium]
MATSEKVLEFLEFVDGQGQQSLPQLLDKILQKSRLLTRAEAGTIFIVKARGKDRWLEPASVQNDAIRVRRADFMVPIGPGSIAGYVAHARKTLLIDDVYAIKSRSPYAFDPKHEHKKYKTSSMLCFPLRNYQDEIIGVVQLINCKPRKNRPPVPFDPAVEALITPIARAVGTLIERAAMLDEIKRANKTLRERNRQLRDQRARIAALQEQTEEAFQLSIRLLARAAEIHDEETGNHIVRCNEYSYAIAKILDMPDSWCDEIRYCAQLHDVGKMSVDAAVLKKKGGLNDAEREEMNRHTEYGYQILSASPRLELGAEIALYHHEKWDGSGYPNGVRGEAIPLSARIVQMADIYDALRSERPYKPAFTHAKAVEIITRGDDRIDPEGHFDPQLIKLFEDNHSEFDRIWNELRD